MKFLLLYFYCILDFLIVLFNSQCKVIFNDTGLLWRPTFELNGPPCRNKVLFYSTLVSTLSETSLPSNSYITVSLVELVHISDLYLV